MPPIGRPVVAVAALATACLAVTACSGGARPHDGLPTSALGPAAAGSAAGHPSFDPATSPTSAAAAAAAWAAVAPSWPTYRIMVTAMGSAGPAGAARATTDVDHGRATTQALPPDGDPTASPRPLAPDFPRSVEDLLRVAAQPDVTRVLYDPTGVPLEIDVDPIPNAIDDEFTYTVDLTVPSQRLLLPSVDRAPTPSATPQRGFPMKPGATLSRDGRSLALVTWGGSTCWPAPTAARAVSATTLLVETVDFPKGGCTLDLRAHLGTVAVTTPTTTPATAVIVHAFVGSAAAPSLWMNTVALQTP